MRVADYLVKKLLEEGIKNTFCVTGRGSLFLTDALKKNQNMKTCFMHHEQSAAFATIASAQLTGNSACCLISTGCSSFNTLTGVLSAWQDSIPSIFISGQNFLNETTYFTKSKKRTYGQQEANIISSVKSITKYSVMLTKFSDIRYELEKAINISQQFPKGPVWLDIPLDIQNSHVDEKRLKKYNSKFKIPLCSNNKINYLTSQIRKSKRPIILVGSGIKLSKAKTELKKFLKKSKIPLVYSYSAPDLYGAKNRLSIGSVGSQGCSRAGNFALQNSDLLIVLGSRLNSLLTGNDLSKFARKSKIVIVDINKFEHEQINKKRLILCDLKILLKKLNKKKYEHKNKWIKNCLRWKRIFSNKEELLQLDNDKKKLGLYQLSEIFSKVMPKDAIFVCDSGFVDVIMPTNIRFGNSQSCIHPVSQGSMGYALPAVAGIQQVTDRPIICVVGDGSVMMNLQELQTIINNKKNVKIFVINNNLYGIIRRRQKLLFRNRTVGTDISNGLSAPKFKNVAKCFGFEYQNITSAIVAEKKIGKIIGRNKSVLCEIFASENQNYIEISYAKNSSGKFVRRPIEDQAPFINRELFVKEMIIKPIDL